MKVEASGQNPIGHKRYVQLLLLAWAAMIGVDFFLHGGLLAAAYGQGGSFLLPNNDAFRRIPFGYLALLATSGLLVWILDRASPGGWRNGLLLGLALGAVMAFSFTLGLFSISTASAQLLAAWFVAQTVEIAVAGGIIAQGLAVRSLRRLALSVALGFVLLLVATVVLQSTGLVPSTPVGSVPIRLTCRWS